MCAELGRGLDLVATPFAGNVLQFDLLVADEGCRSIPIQVKTSRSEQWPSRADLWIKLSVENGKQIDHGDQFLHQPDLIYVFVALGEQPSGVEIPAQADQFLSSRSGNFNRFSPPSTGRTWRSGSSPGIVHVSPLRLIAAWMRKT